MTFVFKPQRRSRNRVSARILPWASFRTVSVAYWLAKAVTIVPLRAFICYKSHTQRNASITVTFSSTYSFYNNYALFPSMTFIFKTTSHRRQLCGRVLACQASGFHQVFE